MSRHQKISIAIVSILTIVLIILAAYYSDFLGARFIKKGSPRLTVRRGEINTLELSPSNQTRKLEICTEKTNIILGRSDFIDCRSLKDFVSPGATEAAVIIPASMPLGRAIVITRIRNADGTLAPLAPTDEKITLYVVPPQGSILTGDGSGSGSGSGGGSGSDGSGAAAPSPNAAQKSPNPSAQPSPIQTIIIPTPTFFFPSPSPVAPSPTPNYIDCYTPGLPEVSITGTPKAELVLTKLDITPKNIVSGTPITVTMELQNIGPAAASKFYIEILYDKYWNGIYDPHTGSSHNTTYDVYHAKYLEVGSLASGGSLRLTHTITNTFYSSTPPVNTETHGVTVNLDLYRENNWQFNDLVPEYDVTAASNYGRCVFKYK